MRTNKFFKTGLLLFVASLGLITKVSHPLKH